MSAALEKLKNRRNNIQELQNRLEAENKKSYESDDERFWYPKLDKAGNALAVIRFLPVFDPEDDNATDWIKLYSHGFQGDNGQWYIENCPTTLPEGICPCCSYNVSLYKTGNEADKKIASKQKRKIHYYTNVYIVSDPTNPEAEGTVKIFRFGTTIFDIIKSAIKPEFQDEIPIDPFDMWGGANFKLKVRKVDGQIRYDKSEFVTPTPLADKDAEIEKIWKQTHKIKEFILPEKFKTYEELEKRLNLVLDLSTPAKKQSKQAVRNSVDDEEESNFDMKIDNLETDSLSDLDDDLDDLKKSFQELAD